MIGNLLLYIRATRQKLWNLHVASQDNSIKYFSQFGLPKLHSDDIGSPNSSVWTEIVRRRVLGIFGNKFHVWQDTWPLNSYCRRSWHIGAVEQGTHRLRRHKRDVNWRNRPILPNSTYKTCSDHTACWRVWPSQRVGLIQAWCSSWENRDSPSFP